MLCVSINMAFVQALEYSCAAYSSPLLSSHHIVELLHFHEPRLILDASAVSQACFWQTLSISHCSCSKIRILTDDRYHTYSLEYRHHNAHCWEPAQSSARKQRTMELKLSSYPSQSPRKSPGTEKASISATTIGYSPVEYTIRSKVARLPLPQIQLPSIREVSFIRYLRSFA